MRDAKKYHVVEVPHSIDHREAPIIGRRAAYAAAMALGDRIAVYECDGRRHNWELILDRTMPDSGRLPKRAQLRNVLRVVELVPQQREIATGVPGYKSRPGYRWAPGYLVPAMSGELMYPPVGRAEAYDLARDTFGADSIIIPQ